MCIVRNERRVNGKGYSVWLRIPTGMKGLPQNRESPQFFPKFSEFLAYLMVNTRDLHLFTKLL